MWNQIRVVNISFWPTTDFRASQWEPCRVDHRLNKVTQSLVHRSKKELRANLTTPM